MALELRLDSSPYQRFLGLTLVNAEKGRVTIRLPFREEFLREDGSDWFHGGIISAFVDIVGDYAIVTVVGTSVPTIDLRVDFVRPARRGDLLGMGTIIRTGRTICIADVQVFDGNDTLVAVGRGAYAAPRP